MNYLTAKYTDIGISKQTNQDSILLLKAKSGSDEILLASVCDGMGGLSKGELASAEMVRALTKWFSERLPVLLYGGLETDALWEDWRRLIISTNKSISSYATRNDLSLGTTAAVLLLINNDYYILNVGDTRVYLLDEEIRQLTKDQTYVQREMDAGRMTLTEATISPDRGLLLQCVGASNVITPELIYGNTGEGSVFLICCDGFRHEVSPDEFFRAFNPKEMVSSEIMSRRIKEITDLNIQRGEEDNISAILIRIE